MSSTPRTRLVAEGLSCTLPDGRVLFPPLDISFGRERTGLIGPNGSGKTTLLRLLAGELRPAAGQAHCSARLGFLRQHVRPAPAATLAQVLGVRERLDALHRLEAGRGTARDLEVVGDDWSLRERIASVLADFDLAHLDPQRPVGTLSGGEGTRVALAGLTLEAPDFLLLDEPTNHLDRDGRDAVERFVAGWPGGLVCVSHDRTLLRRMDRILELGATGARSFGGNYDAYLAARAAEEAAAAREFDSARAALREAERTAREVTERQARRSARGRRSRETANLPKILLNNRRGQAEQTSARIRATSEREVGERQSRLRQARAQVEERPRPRFEVASTQLPAGRVVLELDRVTWRPPGAARDLLEDVSLRLVGPERVAVTGPNGAGKSSLLRLATGRLRPGAGTVRRTARTAFLDQRGVRLAPERSVLDNFRRCHPDMEESRARHALARFLFSHEAALQAVGTLSGGQRLRASLACVLGGERPPELLVLDEPTNHLDLDAIGALESALLAYDGALLVVSHDPDFLAAAGVERELVLG